MVQVPTNQVVDVIAVGDRFMAASGTVFVRHVVGATGVGRGARRGVRPVHGDRAFVDMTIVAVMQVPIVQVVLMITV
jgi:hypothetical protein